MHLDVSVCVANICIFFRLLLLQNNLWKIRKSLFAGKKGKKIPNVKDAKIMQKFRTFFLREAGKGNEGKLRAW